MKGLTLTQKEQARLQVLNGILEGQISVDEAAEVLGVSERHVWRILAEYRKEGAAALAHGNRGRRANNSIPEEARTQVVALARTRYARVNHTHLTELLAEREEIVLGRSTVRRILVGAGMASPRRRRPPLHRVRRQRMSQEGMLVQVDGSVHAWLEERGPRCTLLLAIDDATSTVPYALFRHEEDTHGYFLLMQELIRRCGVPLALYSDRHAVFKYVPGSHQSPAPTQFGRAMAELGVEQIFARSPEAKGRVERANGTFQDRLVTELRLAGARTISEANQVLWAFLTRFNKRFGVPPAQSTNAYRSPDPDLNLAGILCFKHSRKVARDNTVKYNWHTLQLLPSSERSTYVGAHVVVQERLDGKLVVCYQNQIVPTQEAPPRPGVLRTLNATRGLGSVTVENLAAGMDTNGIGGHEREGLGAMTAIGRGLAAGRLTTDRESEAVHPKAQPPRPPTPRQRARWHPDRRRLVSEPVGKQCRGPSVEAFLFGQSPGNWAYPASPSESTLRLQVHLSIRTGSSLLTLDHVEPPSVHNNRPVDKWAIPPGLSIYPRAAPLGSSHHHCHPRCHTKLEVGAFSIIELDNYWLDTATTDIIAGPLP